MNSSKYNFYHIMYRMNRVTATEIWEAADNKEITMDEAVIICGPRPQR